MKKQFASEPASSVLYPPATLSLILYIRQINCRKKSGATLKKGIVSIIYER